MRQFFPIIVILIISITGFNTLLFGQQDKVEIPDDIKFLAELQIIISKNVADSVKSALTDSLMSTLNYSWEDLHKIYQKRFHSKPENAAENMQLIEKYLTEEMRRIQEVGEKKAFEEYDKKARQEKPGNNDEN